MLKVKVAILAACFILMVNVAVTPILAEIARAFPGTSTSLVQMITVIPGMVALPFSLMAGKVAMVITKKTIGLFSMAVMLLGGLIPLVLHDSIGILLLASAVVGVGSGFLIPVTSSLIADYFEHHERGTMMGLQATLINTGGVLFAIIGGMLAQVQWHFTYLVFLLIIPAIILFAVLLPKGERVKNTGEKGLGLNRTIAYLSMASFFFGLLYTTYSTNVALYLDSTHLGDATAAAVAISLFSSVGIISGLLFGRTSRMLKQYTLPLAVGLAALGLAFTYIGGSLVMVFVGGLLIGYGLSTLMPYGVFTATQTVTPAATSLAIAVFTASVNLGAFGSPMLINTLASVTGDGSEKARFLVAAVGLSVLFALVLLRELRKHRPGRQAPSSQA